MKRDELEAMLTLRRGDHRAVAARVLSQWAPSLDDDEEAFLRAHLPRLDFSQLARWLAFRPARPAPLVEALAEALPREAHVALWQLLRWCDAIEPEVWAHATELLRPRLPAAAWAELHLRTRGGARYDALVRAEAALARARALEDGWANEPVTARLGPVRFDDRACVAGLAALLAGGCDDPRAVRAARVLLDAGEGASVHDPALRERAARYLDERAAPRAEATERLAVSDELRLDGLLDAGASEALEALLPPPDAPRAETDEPALDGARLAWLAAHGASRRELLELALGALATARSEAQTASLLGWLARQLPSRSAWEEHGARVLGALFKLYRWDLLGRVCTFLEQVLEAGGEAAGAGTNALLLRSGAPPAWASALHVAFGEALCAQVRDDAARGDGARARGALEALVHLTLPPRFVRPLRALREAPGLDDEARGLLDLHVQLCRRADPTRATLDGALVALRELCLLDAA